MTLSYKVSAFYPTTFCACDPSECFVLARLDAFGSDGKPVTETRFMRLAATPSTAVASVLQTERILEGAPRTAGAMRDPSQPSRIIGHCGGRLWQLGKALPAAYALERFTPSGMTSQEFLEHICQVIQAVAVPDAVGTMHIISRALLGTPVDLTVDVVTVVETFAWENFFSIIRVSGQGGDDVYADSYSDVAGGRVLEYSSHPLIWSVSGCEAMGQGGIAAFGRPRTVQKQRWFCTDASSPSPWEGMPALTVLRINGDPQQWLLYALSDSRIKGEATATLLEVV